MFIRCFGELVIILYQCVCVLCSICVGYRRVDLIKKRGDLQQKKMVLGICVYSTGFNSVEAPEKTLN